MTILYLYGQFEKYPNWVVERSDLGVNRPLDQLSIVLQERERIKKGSFKKEDNSFYKEHNYI